MGHDFEAILAGCRLCLNKRDRLRAVGYTTLFGSTLKDRFTAIIYN